MTALGQIQLRNVVEKMDCWRIRSWETINRKFECQQLSNLNEKFPTSYFRRSYRPFLISRLFQIDFRTSRANPGCMQLERAVGKKEKLETFESPSRSWKIFYYINNTLKTFQLRSIFSNLNINFLTSDFSTQNFPTSRFFQLSFLHVSLPIES